MNHSKIGSSYLNFFLEDLLVTMNMLSQLWVRRPDPADNASSKRQRVGNVNSRIAVWSMNALPREVLALHHPLSYGISTTEQAWGLFGRHLYVWDAVTGNSCARLSVPPTLSLEDGASVMLMKAGVVLVTGSGGVCVWQSLNSAPYEDHTLNVRNQKIKSIRAVNDSNFVVVLESEIAIRLEVNFVALRVRWMKQLDVKVSQVGIWKNSLFFLVRDSENKTSLRHLVDVFGWDSKGSLLDVVVDDIQSTFQAVPLAVDVMQRGDEYIPVIVTCTENGTLQVHCVSMNGEYTSSKGLETPSGSQLGSLKTVVVCDKEPLLYICFEVEDETNFILWLASIELNTLDSWNTTKLNDITNGWFGLQVSSSIKTHAMVVSATCILGLYTDVSASSSSIQDSSLKNVATLGEDEAIDVLKRMFRSYLKNGIAVAKDDSKWDSLQTTPLHLMHRAIVDLLQQELDRRPQSMWAEKWSNNDEWTKHYFSQPIVRRHLVTKQNNLDEFFSSIGILDTWPERTLFKRNEMYSKLGSLLRLCDFQGSLTKSMNQMLVERLDQVLKRRLDITDVDVLEEKLEDSGVSVPFLFYSNVSQVADLVLEQWDLHSTDSLILTAQIMIAVLNRVPCCGFDAVMWYDSEEVIDSVRRCVESLETHLLSKNISRSTYATLFQLFKELVLVYLTSKSTIGSLSQEDTGIFVNVALHCDDLEYATLMSERYVCLEGLIQVTERAESPNKALQRYLEISSSSLLNIVERDGLVSISSIGGVHLLVGDLFSLKARPQEIPEFCWIQTYERSSVSYEYRGWFLNMTKNAWCLSRTKHFFTLRHSEGCSVISHGAISLALQPNESTVVALLHAEDWNLLPRHVFKYFMKLQKPHRILEIVEEGQLDNHMEAFLLDVDDSESSFQLTYLDHLRRKQFKESSIYLRSNHVNDSFDALAKFVSLKLVPHN